jgi:hypothetical protein
MSENWNSIWGSFVGAFCWNLCKVNEEANLEEVVEGKAVLFSKLSTTCTAEQLRTAEIGSLRQIQEPESRIKQPNISA